MANMKILKDAKKVYFNLKKIYNTKVIQKFHNANIQIDKARIK